MSTSYIWRYERYTFLTFQQCEALQHYSLALTTYPVPFTQCINFNSTLSSCGLLHVWVHGSLAFTLIVAFSAN